jgi:hypothetical protein
MDLFSFCLFSFLFVFQLAGGLDDTMVGLGYDPIMVKREISAGDQAELLGLPRNLSADLTKAARSHSHRLAHASRSMARSMVEERNFMVVSCPCSPSHQFTVYGKVHTGNEWPRFQSTCNQGCDSRFQQWYPVHVGESLAKKSAFLEQVEAGKAVSCNGGFTCVNGCREWDVRLNGCKAC